MELLLLFILYALLFIYLLIYHVIPKLKCNNTNEHFENKLGNVKIVQKINKSFDLDNYIAYDDGKEILKSGGKWNLDEKNLYVMHDKIKIDIIDNKNVYTFKNKYDVQLTFRNNDVCGTMIINDHMDELNVCHSNTDEYIFKRKNIDIADVKLEKKGNDENIYLLNIINKSAQNYKEIFIISFIIFNQIEKELNLSFDEIL